MLDPDGYSVLRRVFSDAESAEIATELEAALQSPEAAANGAISGASTGVYAARNVLALWPRAGELWRRRALRDPLSELLGERFGLVRVLYFDKPPEQSWALPWHKDLTIAVRDNRLPSERFAKPTTKAGVPHVEAPLEVLQTMVTARLHLDDVTDENGPLRALPGSQRSGKEERLDGAPVSIHAAAGDVLLMSPLLMHCSNRSLDGTTRRRRVLHLEFASSPDLPDGYHWHTFIPDRPARGA